MKATGIVRRIDDLGRVVIPKEIRRTLRIREGDPLEIYTDVNGEVIFKKYSPVGELSQLVNPYAEVLWKTSGFPALITDKDHVVAVSGISKKEFQERRISSALEELMESRQSFMAEENDTKDLVPVENVEEKALTAYPIISAGDVTGAVVLLKMDADRCASEIEDKLVQAAASFLGRQME